MRSLIILALPAAFASESEVCANDGTCAQDEATLLQMTKLRERLNVKQTHPANQMQGCPSSSNFDDDFETGGVRCCSMDGSDGNSGNFPRTRTFPDGSSVTGRDCGAGECNGDSEATCHEGVTFAQAAELCRANGERLCTSEEMSVTCGTGCMHNHHSVWFSDDPPNMAQGCPGSSQAYDETSGAVRCCSMNGDDGNSGNFPATFTFSDGSTSIGRDCEAGDCRNDEDAACHDNVATLAQAEELCRANGERLCTRDELHVTCGTGCRHNHHLVWVSDLAPSGESNYIGCFVDDNARDLGPMLGSATNAATDSFDECARACDKRYIALQWGGECFCSDTYGNGDQYIQVDDEECGHEREPCASTSFNCGGTWHQAIYRNRARAATSDGCRTSNYEEGEYPTTFIDADTVNTAALRCCSMDGQSCTTQNLEGSTVGDVFNLDGNVVAQQACLNEVTFSEAEAICAAGGRRLCTSDELDSGVCCGTGCWHDHRAIWTSN